MIEKVAWHRRLTVRVLFFLTLALVPLGAIGIVQNAELIAVSEKRSELSLLALTDGASSGERQLIQRAFGSAAALGFVIEEVLDNPELCRENLQRFVTANSDIVYAGFLPISGISACSTAGRTIDFSQYPSFSRFIQDPRPSVSVNLDAPGSRQAVMIINQPHYYDDVFQGFVSISLPLKTVGQADDFLTDTAPVMLATLNENGEMLSSETDREAARAEMPANIPLDTLIKHQARKFVATNQAGVERIYGVVPIIPGVVYALGAFSVESLNRAGTTGPRFSLLLPLLMWGASLLVAWFAIDRLVLVRISGLYVNMQRFARNRTLPKFELAGVVSAELHMLETAFNSMAQDLLHDEAQQESQIREKSILLKEVHHRVKNNLQIISSIMNMQIRKAKSPETKLALSQVQDRIMGFSGIHRTLYQAENLTEINAAHLVAKIVDETIAMGKSRDRNIQFKTELDQMVVFPDQAVPLSMLVAEALTNALKYVGDDPDGTSSISVTLRLTDEKHASLGVANSRHAPTLQNTDPTISTGLGQQLIKAFAIQLNGKLLIEETAHSYSISVDFEVEEFNEAVVDY